MLVNHASTTGGLVKSLDICRLKETAHKSELLDGAHEMANC